MIKLKNMGKIYDSNKDNKFEALKDINVEFQKGELIAIIGRSGSGKTTLLNILALIDKATCGEYYFEEKNISKMSYKELCKFRNKKVGVVFQNFNLLDDYSLVENIELPLQYSNDKSNSYNKAIKMLESLGLKDHKNKKISELSGGQKQRVAIGRALINEPELLLADEPTGALDIEHGTMIMELFLDINKRGKTVVIITHDEKIANRCNRIIKIDDGKIIEDVIRRKELV